MKLLCKLLLIIIIVSCNKIKDLSPAFIGKNHKQEKITNDYYPARSGDITFHDSDFQYSINGYAKTNFTARSTAGYVEFRTSETSISVKVGGDLVADCEVLVNGVWYQSIRVRTANVLQITAITLPPGEKIVRLINGFTSGGGVTLPKYGVYIQGIVTTGPIEIKRPVTPENKWLMVGNSITTGASGTHPSSTGFPALFREGGRKVQVDAWSGRVVATTSSKLANIMATHLSAQMNGIKKNELFILLGTNNYGTRGQSKATFKSYYLLMLDAIISLRPDVTIYCVSLTNRKDYDTGNTSGAFGDDFADAIKELVATRPTTRFIYGKPLISLSNMADQAQLHPNQTGMQELHDNLLISYNSLQ